MMVVMARRGILSTLLLLATLAPEAASAQFTGLSAYAATSPRFPCDAYLNIVERAQYPAMAIVWGTFGDDLTCAERFLDTNKDRPHLLEIHFSNEACRRKHNCGEGELARTLSVKSYDLALRTNHFLTIRELELRAVAIRDWANDHGNSNTNMLLSTGLEDDLSDSAYVQLHRHIRFFWPYLITRSPNGAAHGHTLPGDFRERHGNGARCRSAAELVNEDGSTPSTAESRRFLSRNRGCLARFLWRAKHQGRTKNNRPVYPRRSRIFDIPDRDVETLGQLLANQ